MNPFRRNVAEIQGDRALRTYGGLLALTHGLTWIFWRTSADVRPTFTDKLQNPYCWPFFESCAAIRPFTLGAVDAVLFFYFALALLAAAAFFSGKFTRTAYGLLALATALKAAIFVQDFRLMGNYHYMQFAALAVFLFVPRKRIALKLLVVSFYVAAGLLKLNYEWLSGMAMIRRPVITGLLLEWACAYVVLLELGLVFGLLAKQGRIFALTAFQLFLFHAFSWHIVGFFYPSVMACLLAIFVLDRLWPADEERLPGFRDFFGEPRYRGALAALAIFWTAQAIPHFYSADASVTGEGRMFSLNMFDSRTDCVGLLSARSGSDRFERIFRPEDTGLGVRIWCDPIVLYNEARALCDSLRKEDPEAEVDVGLISRRFTDGAFRTVVGERNFCGSGIGYNTIFPNTWIRRW